MRIVDVEHDGEWMYAQTECDNCGAGWHGHYQLAGVYKPIENIGDELEPLQTDVPDPWNYCPYCHSNNIDYDVIERWPNDLLEYLWHCKDCRNEWQINHVYKGYNRLAGEEDESIHAQAARLAKALLEAPEFKTLKKGRTKLSPEERAEVLRRKAVWHHGPHGEATPAVWKAKVKGKDWFVTNTHRAYNVRPSLAGAISRYHKFIKGTA